MFPWFLLVCQVGTPVSESATDSLSVGETRTLAHIRRTREAVAAAWPEATVWLETRSLPKRKTGLCVAEVNLRQPPSALTVVNDCGDTLLTRRVWQRCLASSVEAFRVVAASKLISPWCGLRIEAHAFRGGPNGLVEPPLFAATVPRSVLADSALTALEIVRRWTVLALPVADDSEPP